MFRQGFQTCISFVQLTFKWKIFLLKCVHFCSFLALWTEKIGLQQKLYRKGRTKLPFPCPEELFGKHSFPWRTYNFLINFCFEPIKFRLFCGIIAADLSKLHYLVSTKHSDEKKIHWKSYNFVSDFPHFEPKKSRIQQKCFGGSVKIAFFVPSKYFREKSIGKMNTNFSSFVGFERKCHGV